MEVLPLLLLRPTAAVRGDPLGSECWRRFFVLPGVRSPQERIQSRRKEEVVLVGLDLGDPSE